MSIESVMPSSHLILCHPLLLPPSIFPSIRVFSNESVIHIRWPKYRSLSFSISPSNEYSRLISFRIDWLDLLEVQGILKSLLQHHSAKASVLWCSTFFMVQLSHPYLTTGKTIAFTRWTFVGKVMSLLFNTLSRFVITFLPRSKHLSISWLKSPSAVTLEFYISFSIIKYIHIFCNSCFHSSIFGAKIISCAQSLPTLCSPIHHSPSGSSVLGIIHERILEWVAMLSSRAASQPRY